MFFHFISDFDETVMKTVCKSAEKGPNAIKLQTIMEIWSSRILRGAEEYGTLPIYNPNAQYKVDFLMEVIDIFAASCPRISHMYLSVLGNVFLMHMRQAWANSSSTGNGIPDQNWIEVWGFLQDCGVTVTSNVLRTRVMLKSICIISNYTRLSLLTIVCFCYTN